MKEYVILKEDYIFLRNKYHTLQDNLVVKQSDVAIRLQTYRKQNRLSVREMASSLNMDESYLNKIMHGLQSMSMTNLSTIDSIFTELGLELPPLYVRAWVRLED